MSELKKYIEAASQCSRCGTCAVNCPVFQVTQEESLLARGKMQLIENVLQDQIPLTREVEKRLNACLLCGACTAGCPSGVSADKIILAARREAVEKFGLPPLKALAFAHLIPQRWRFNLGLKALSVIQSFLPADKEAGAVYRHLPFSFLGFSDQIALPPVAPQSLSKLWVNVKIPQAKARVAFFSGCLIEYVYPEIGLALQKLLNRLQIEVILPRQHCCGTPIIMSGEITSAKKLAELNANSFYREDYDYILTACASCGSTLKNHYPQLLGENDFSGYVLDSNEFLIKHTDVMRHLGKFTQSVTYHDPCHLARHQGIVKEPRQLLQGTEARLVEMADADRCCGNGGTFAIYYPELSQKILRRKIETVRATAAENLVTSCPGCLLQLKRGLAQQKMPLKTFHILELLDTAYQA